MITSTHHPRGQFLATVLSNTPLCREHYRLTLRCADFPKSQPGQFVQIACIDPAHEGFVDHVIDDWSPGQTMAIEGADLLGRQTTLRRPFSIAGRRDSEQGPEIDIIGRAVGVGTCWLSQLKPAQHVNVIGPLGNAFALPPPGGTALLIGGGVGIPPMIYLAQTLAQDLADPSVAKPRKAIAFCGATTLDLLALTVTNDAPRPGPGDVNPLYNIAEFQPFNVPVVITTDDGSYGFKGFVTQALEQYLDAWITDNADRNRTVIYTCGPEPMMKAVGQIAMRRQIACQIAVERAMACGMGTCQSCCIKVKKDDPAQPPLAGSDWSYRLACTDGPVFPAEKLLW